MKFIPRGGRLLNRAYALLMRHLKTLPVILVVLHLLLGAFYSLAVPPWEAHDEWAHYKFVEYVARHRALPPPGERLTNEYEFDEANQPPLYYVIAALPVLFVDTADGFVPQVNPHFSSQTGAGGINAAIHHPDPERFPGHGTLLALRLARLMSLLISLGGLVATYQLGRLLAPARPAVALTALALAALSPQYLFISAVVTNDVLIAVLGSVVAWLSVKVALEGLRPGPTLALALTTGLALVTKLSALALLPVVAVALVVGATRAVRRGANWRTIGATLGIAAGTGVILVALWLGRNLRLTGTILPRDPWVSLRFVMRWVERSDDVAPMRLADLPGALNYGFRTFWASFGWGNLEAYPWVYRVFAALCLAGLLGLILWLADRRVKRGLKFGAGLAGILAGSVLFMAAYRDFDYGSTLIRGRYLLPGLAAVAVLIAIGLDALVRGIFSRLDRRAWLARRIVPAGLVALLTATNLALPWGVIAPAYAPPAMLATGAQVGDLAPLQPGDHPLGARFMAPATDAGPAAELVAYQLWPAQVRPGEALRVTLVWRVWQPLPRNYTVGVHLLDADLAKVGEINVYPGRGNYATTLWQPGDVFREVYWVPVTAAIAQPMAGRVKVALFVEQSPQADPAVVGDHLDVTDAEGTPLGDAVLFGRFKLAPADAAGEPSPGAGLARLGDAVRLTNVQVTNGSAAVVAGAALIITLTWDVLSPPAADYQVFVHLDCPQGTVAYGDGPPAQGRYPTSLWARGEQIVDPHVLHVPAETPAGRYRLVAGLYDHQGGRLAAYGPDGGRFPVDQIPLSEIAVVRWERRGFLPWLPAAEIHEPGNPANGKKEP